MEAEYKKNLINHNRTMVAWFSAITGGTTVILSTIFSNLMNTPVATYLQGGIGWLLGSILVGLTGLFCCQRSTNLLKSSTADTDIKGESWADFGFAAKCFHGLFLILATGFLIGAFLRADGFKPLLGS